MPRTWHCALHTFQSVKAETHSASKALIAFEDDIQRFWGGTRGGVQRYKKRTWKIDLGS